MTASKVSCVVRGNTFFGTFRVSGDSHSKSVTLTYNGEERSADLNGFDAREAAERLLREAAFRDCAAMEPPAYPSVGQVLDRGSHRPRSPRVRSTRVQPAIPGRDFRPSSWSSPAQLR